MGYTNALQKENSNQMPILYQDISQTNGTNDFITYNVPDPITMGIVELSLSTIAKIITEYRTSKNPDTAYNYLELASRTTDYLAQPLMVSIYSYCLNASDQIDMIIGNNTSSMLATVYQYNNWCTEKVIANTNNWNWYNSQYIKTTLMQHPSWTEITTNLFKSKLINLVSHPDKIVDSLSIAINDLFNEINYSIKINAAKRVRSNSSIKNQEDIKNLYSRLDDVNWKLIKCILSLITPFVEQLVYVYQRILSLNPMEETEL